MKIAYIHYHLKTGGVATVLKQQIEAVQDNCELLVLTGEQPKTPWPCDIVHIPGLGYDRPDKKNIDPEKVAASVIEAISLKWENGCDILHVHNPTLAKNRYFLKILQALQRQKIKFLLQIHDFAEDGRPQAYYGSDQYIADCHYAAINTRDYHLLLKAGLKKEGLHKITNTVRAFESDAAGQCAGNLVLYPIRAIRRKNIGEALLLSLFFNNDKTLAITLPPNSRVDMESYNGWKAYARQKNLKVAFDIGLTHPFTELVRSAGYLITTSITEGFGFSFLEPWTAEKMLWGRKLADICHDFEASGIQLNHLYTRLRAPIAWLDKNKLLSTWQTCVSEAAARFNLSIKATTILDAFEKIVADQTIDFGLLNEAFQKQIIASVLAKPENRNHLIQLNPYLATPAMIADPDALIQANRTAVLNAYSKTGYTKKLLDTYRKVIETDVTQRIDKRVLAAEFLNLKNFSLLKWGPYLEE